MHVFFSKTPKLPAAPADWGRREESWSRDLTTPWRSQPDTGYMSKKWVVTNKYKVLHGHISVKNQREPAKAIAITYPYLLTEWKLNDFTSFITRNALLVRWWTSRCMHWPPIPPKKCGLLPMLAHAMQTDFPTCFHYTHQSQSGINVSQPPFLSIFYHYKRWSLTPRAMQKSHLASPLRRGWCPTAAPSSPSQWCPLRRFSRAWHTTIYK